MKTITIVFTKSKKKLRIGSWIIQLWTRKPYSHVARMVKIRDWGCGYYQSNEGKTNYEHESVFLQKHEIVKQYSIEITDTMDNEIRKTCWRDAGKPYGIMQNIGIAIVDIAKFFGKKIENPWKSGDNCSELLYKNVFKILQPGLDYDPDTIKPHHIEEILTTYYEGTELKLEEK